MTLLDSIPRFARGNKFKKAELKTGSNQQFDSNQKIEDAGLYDANLITSESVEGKHIPLIDIDMEAALIPSSSPNHYHLYIDHEMSFDNYVKLLKVMQEVGIVQKGYAEGTEKRGFGALRLPHVKKHSTLDNPFEEW